MARLPFLFLFVVVEEKFIHHKWKQKKQSGQAGSRQHKQITLEKAIHIITIPIKAHLRQKIID